MSLPRKLVRTVGLSVASVLTVAGLTVVTVPASADNVGVLAVEEANGIVDETTDLQYDISGTPLLDHFWFRDVNDDQHLRILSARPHVAGTQGRLRVGFSDFAGREQFEYRVAHQMVPSTPDMVPGAFSDRCRGTCTRRIDRPAGDYVFVLRGFIFEFFDGVDGEGNDIPIDHHIDEIGIQEENGLLTHWYNDQNDDDQYKTFIDYVWVPRSTFSNIRTLSGTVHAAGVTSPSMPAGNKVIRGFHVDNLASGGAGDNHIKRFGFLTNTTDVDIYYGDNNPADSADWSYQLQFAILK